MRYKSHVDMTLQMRPSLKKRDEKTEKKVFSTLAPGLRLVTFLIDIDTFDETKLFYACCSSYTFYIIVL